MRPTASTGLANTVRGDALSDTAATAPMARTVLARMASFARLLLSTGSMGSSLLRRLSASENGAAIAVRAAAMARALRPGATIPHRGRTASRDAGTEGKARASPENFRLNYTVASGSRGGEGTWRERKGGARGKA